MTSQIKVYQPRPRDVVRYAIVRNGHLLGVYTTLRAVLSERYQLHVQAARLRDEQRRGLA